LSCKGAFDVLDEDTLAADLAEGDVVAAVDSLPPEPF